MMTETGFQRARIIVGSFLDQLKSRGLVDSFNAVEIPATVPTEKIYLQATGFAERYVKRPCTPKGDYALTLRENPSGGLSVMFDSVAASATHSDVMDIWASENTHRRGAFKDVSQTDFKSYLDGVESLMSACIYILQEDARQQGFKTNMPARRF